MFENENIPTEVVTYKPRLDVEKNYGLLAKVCVLIGYKKLKSGKVVNLVTPFTMWEAIEGTPQYKFITDLLSDVHDCEQEVLNYLNGKCSSEQLALELETNED